MGTLRHPDNSVYVGKHGGCLPDGPGEYTYANGEKFVGGWKQGKKHGKGAFAPKQRASSIEHLMLDWFRR